MYKGFIQDLSNIDLWKDNKGFLQETAKSLQEPLSRDNNKLIEQIIDAEAKRAKLVWLLAMAKAEKDKATATAWKNKGAIKHGEAKIADTEVADETKEYSYMVRIFEGYIECIDTRLPLGKRLIEVER